MYWIRSTVGDKETHSRDGLDYILHTGEGSWTVVWRGEATAPTLSTRELARRVIRAHKTRSNRQLDLLV
jgi:hypothetical protein